MAVCSEGNFELDHSKYRWVLENMAGNIAGHDCLFPLAFCRLTCLCLHEQYRTRALVKI